MRSTKFDGYLEVEKPISRLSAKPTIEELADQAFKAISKKDEKLLKQIEQAVPTKTYESPDRRYQERIDALSHVALLWQNDYWQHQALLARSLLASRKKIDKKQHESDDTAIDRAEYHRNILIAHGYLLDGLEQHGVDKQALLDFCGLEANPVDWETLDLPDYAKEHYENTLAFYVSHIDGKEADPKVFEYLGVPD
jgi:hypothetical protein